eukprot:CAMPEP_0176344280 /NCGR_PEP_ID=MMETSP0126-20121128/4585_1 /TAXON_ID=141414 ORGANISM="Strombidinopsis acuminatum, Strain SPMC142" /NCGR_SAMPLE_ID=MMETSP0126 /ASSEMBLY_ACC=CAM_ASM_000229 /LENGTH=57 /DNA_ID=CAMNT_0017690669 /DNA_START=118 /DNA_END=291 /DNA_ORIENTATION=-
MASLTNENFIMLKNLNPSVFLKFKNSLKDYQDDDMKQRELYVQNVPYFRNLPHETIV